jgi:hypothetical protein
VDVRSRPARLAAVTTDPASPAGPSPTTGAQLVAALAEPLSFDCPRCGTAVVEAFYGPCGACRTVLKVTLARADATSDADAAPARFEPKMNVVPNQVATKD